MKTVEYEGKIYELSPLTLGALERLGDRFDKLSLDATTTSERISTIIDVTHASIKRKHPEVTREMVAEMIDTANMLKIYVEICGMSGLGGESKKAVGGETVSS